MPQPVVLQSNSLQTLEPNNEPILAFTTPVTAGNYLLAAVRWRSGNGPIPVVYDSRGNDWHPIYEDTTHAVWYAIARDSGSCTLTFEYFGDAFSFNMDCYALEISGAASATFGANNGTSNAITVSAGGVSLSDNVFDFTVGTWAIGLAVFASADTPALLLAVAVMFSDSSFAFEVPSGGWMEVFPDQPNSWSEVVYFTGQETGGFGTGTGCPITCQDNFSDTNPSPPVGEINVKWQASLPYVNQTSGVKARDISGHVPAPQSGGQVAAGATTPMSVAPGAAGSFVQAHGLTAAPSFVTIQMMSPGAIWLGSPPFDSTNINLVSSDPSATAIVTPFVSAPTKQIALAPTAPGKFQVTHGLGQIPALVLLEPTSNGAIWFGSPAVDANNIYLEASDSGVTAQAQVFANQPVLSPVQFAKVPLAPSGPGAFSVPHGLSKTPSLVIVNMDSSGAIWLGSPPADSENLNLVASDVDVSGEAEVWTSDTLPAPTEIALTPGAAGNFTVAHSLGVTPKAVLIQMTSGGAIWLQSSRYDSTNLYLVTSDAGVTGYAEIWI